MRKNKYSIARHQLLFLQVHEIVIPQFLLLEKPLQLFACSFTFTLKTSTPSAFPNMDSNFLNIGYWGCVIRIIVFSPVSSTTTES